jgi:GAF domain-containing protein
MNQLLSTLAPRSDDPVIAHRQMVLYTTLLILTTASLVWSLIILALWYVGQAPLLGVLAALVSLPVFLSAYLLGRGGYVALAGSITSVVVFATVVASMWVLGFGGISVVGMAVTVLTSAALLGLPAAGIFVLLNAGTYAAIAMAEAGGLVQNSQLTETSITADVISLSVGLSVVALLLWLSRREIGATLRSERQVKVELNRQTQTLQQEVEVYARELERQGGMLKTSTDIARMATERIPPFELMEKAVELIRARLGYYQTSIFLLDESGNWLELTTSAGEAGQRLVVRDQRLAVGSASIVGWVAANREPRIAQDVLKDPFHRRNPLLLETRAEAAIPLLVGDHLLGVLDIQSRAVGSFTDVEIQTLRGFADNLSIALDAARLNSERESNVRRFTQEYREQAQASWDRLYRSGARTLVQLGIDGEADGELTCVGEATNTGTTVLSPDRTEVAVPVEVRGLVIAAIGVRKREPGEVWSESEIALLETVASQTGLALETARQYADERRRVTELEALNRVSQAASQLLQPDTLMRVVQRQVAQVVGPCDLTVARYHPEGERISFPFALREGSRVELAPRPLGDDLISVIIRTRQPLLLPDRVSQRAQELGAHIPTDQAPESWLGTPMLAAEHVVGAIALAEHRASRHFTEDDVAFMTTVASQIASASQNSDLLAQIRRTARRDRLIREITSKIRRSPDMSNVLETAAQELGHSFDARYARVHLGTQPGDQGEPHRPTRSHASGTDESGESRQGEDAK